MPEFKCYDITASPVFYNNRSKTIEAPNVQAAALEFAKLFFKDHPSRHGDKLLIVVAHYLPADKIEYTRFEVTYEIGVRIIPRADGEI